MSDEAIVKDGESGRVQRCFHLSLAYDGSNFSGWQIQSKVRTVQGELTARLRRLFQQPELKIAGTSRTDAGVHALDQQASFTTEVPEAMDAARLMKILQRWLPPDIRLKNVVERELGYNVRFEASGKAYTYVLDPTGVSEPLFSRFAWKLLRNFDLDAMRAAAGYFAGEHDFSSFAVNPKQEVRSHVRRLHKVEIYQVGELICFSVVGESFLYKMVRSIVGWLVHVGCGGASAEDTPKVLAACDRSLAAASAPGNGLFLVKVFFEPDEWLGYEPVLPPFSWQPEKKC